MLASQFTTKNKAKRFNNNDNVSEPDDNEEPKSNMQGSTAFSFSFLVGRQPSRHDPDDDHDDEHEFQPQSKTQRRRARRHAKQKHKGNTSSTTTATATAHVETMEIPEELPTDDNVKQGGERASATIATKVGSVTSNVCEDQFSASNGPDTSPAATAVTATCSATAANHISTSPSVSHSDPFPGQEQNQKQSSSTPQQQQLQASTLTAALKAKKQSCQTRSNHKSKSTNRRSIALKEKQSKITTQPQPTSSLLSHSKVVQRRTMAFNSENKGKAMVNKSSLLVHRELVKQKSSKQEDNDSIGKKSEASTTAFTFGFDLDLKSK